MAQDCGSWWNEHVSETYQYVQATRSGNAAQQQRAVEHLLAGVDEWGRLTGIPEAADLMRRHVEDVKALVDAAFAGDKATIDQSVNLLIENVGYQTGLYDSKLKPFPADAWEKLFTAHVAATGAYVLALASGDMDDFRRNFTLVQQDRDELLKLWRTVCGRIRG